MDERDLREMLAFSARGTLGAAGGAAAVPKTLTLSTLDLLAAEDARVAEVAAEPVFMRMVAAAGRRVGGAARVGGDDGARTGARNHTTWRWLDLCFYTWMLLFIGTSVGCMINTDATMSALFGVPMAGLMLAGDWSASVGVVSGLIVVPCVLAWCFAVLAAPCVFLLGQPFAARQLQHEDDVRAHLRRLAAVRTTGGCLARLRAGPRILAERKSVRYAVFWGWCVLIFLGVWLVAEIQRVPYTGPY